MTAGDFWPLPVCLTRAGSARAAVFGSEARRLGEVMQAASSLARREIMNYASYTCISPTRAALPSARLAQSITA